MSSQHNEKGKKSTKKERSTTDYITKKSFDVELCLKPEVIEDLKIIVSSQSYATDKGKKMKKKTLPR